MQSENRAWRKVKHTLATAALLPSTRHAALDEQAPKERRKGSKMATISTVYKGDMVFESAVGDHVVKVDVPAGIGGKNRAPTPPEFFIVSLGSCVAAVVTNYCNKSGVDPTGMSVDVSYDKGENPNRLVNIRVKVTLPNCELKDRQKAIERVAEHCPVHETVILADHIEFEIQGKPAPMPA